MVADSSAGLPNPKVFKGPGGGAGKRIAPGRAQDRWDGGEPAEDEVDN